MQIPFQIAAGATLGDSPLLCCGEARGLERPGEADFEGARGLAAELIGEPVAAAGTLAEIDAVHPGTILIRRERGAVAGLLAVLPLRQAGREALLGGRLDGLRPDLDLVSRPQERPAAVYAWGCAARTKRAARAVMRTTAALPEEVFVGVNFFARAATPAGWRALTLSLGYAPVGEHGLLRRMPPLRRAA